MQASQKRSKDGKQFVDLIGRKKWDLDEYERKAQEKLDAEAEADRLTKAKERKQREIVLRDPLQQRTKELQLWRDVGKFQVINNSTPESQKGGFYCKICECRLMDSLAWMNHINGRRHNKNLGMNMQPKRATASDVRSKLQKLSAKKLQEKEEAAADVESRFNRVKREIELKRKRAESAGGEHSDEDVSSEDEDHSAVPSSAKRLKEAASPPTNEEDEEIDEETRMMAMMGMAISFGGSKKNS